jgi:hypothetical protein
MCAEQSAASAYAHDCCNILDKASSPSTATSRVFIVMSRRMTLINIDRPPANSSRSCRMISRSAQTTVPEKRGLSLGETWHGRAARRRTARRDNYRYLRHCLSHPLRKFSVELCRWNFLQRGLIPSQIALQQCPRRPLRQPCPPLTGPGERNAL